MHRPVGLGIYFAHPIDALDMIPLTQHGTYPIEVLGPAVLVLSLAVTIIWLVYMYR